MTDLRDQLKDGGTVVVVNGNLWGIKRTCYLKFGHFLQVIHLDKPAVVKRHHEEIADTGSDVTDAFTVGVATKGSLE